MIAQAIAQTKRTCMLSFWGNRHSLSIKNESHLPNQISWQLLNYLSTVFCAQTGHVEYHAEQWIKFRDRIKPISKLSKSKPVDSVGVPIGKISSNKISNKILFLCILEAPILANDWQKITAGINKNSILANYNKSCIKKRDCIPSIYHCWRWKILFRISFTSSSHCQLQDEAKLNLILLSQDPTF